MNTPILSLRNVGLSYPGSGFALQDIAFDLYKGKITGIVGPNGSGKTTLLSVITNLQEKKSGELSYHGSPAVGAIVHSPSFFPYLSARDNLRYICDVKGLGDCDAMIEDALRKVGLPSNKMKYKKFSYGMAQRLGIASALMGDPDIIVLDEPTVGIDPVDIDDIKRLIKGAITGNNAILTSSHQIDEIEEICDFLLCLNKGRQVYFGPVATVREKAKNAGTDFKTYVIQLLKGGSIQ